MCNFYGKYNADIFILIMTKTQLNFYKYRSLCQEYISWKTKKNIKNIFADQTYLEQLIKDFKILR